MPTKFKPGYDPWNKGKTGIYSEETHAIMSQNRKEWWAAHPEEREAFRQRNLGKITSEEKKKKTSATLTGVPKTDEHRKNISLGRTGLKRKPFTEEHKRKMSESRKLYLEKKHDENKPM